MTEQDIGWLNQLDHELDTFAKHSLQARYIMDHREWCFLLHM